MLGEIYDPLKDIFDENRSPRLYQTVNRFTPARRWQDRAAHSSRICERGAGSDAAPRAPKVRQGQWPQIVE